MCEFKNLKINMYPGLMDGLYNMFVTGILFDDLKNYDFEWTSRYDPNDLKNYHMFFRIETLDLLVGNQEFVVIDDNNRHILNTPLNPNNGLIVTKEGSLSDSEILLTKNFIESCIRDVKVKLIVDSVKNENRLTVCARKIGALFIDSNSQKTTFIKSFGQHGQFTYDENQEFSSAYNNETMKINMTLSEKQKDFKIYFNETHLIVCFDLLKQLSPYIDIKEENYPKGFEPKKKEVETSLNVKVFYNNASLGLPDGFKKEAIVSRGDVNIEMIEINDKEGNFSKGYFEISFNGFELFTCQLTEYKECTLKNVFKRNIAYPTNFSYKQIENKKENCVKSKIDDIELKLSMKDLETIKNIVNYQTQTRTNISDLKPYENNPKFKNQKEPAKSIKTTPEKITSSQTIATEKSTLATSNKNTLSPPKKPSTKASPKQLSPQKTQTPKKPPLADSKIVKTPVRKSQTNAVSKTGAQTPSYPKATTPSKKQPSSNKDISTQKQSKDL